MVHHSFWLASHERLNIRSTKYKHKYSLDLDCFETKRNVDDVDVYLINTQYKIQIVTAQEGNMGNCHPEKTYVDQG